MTDGEKPPRRGEDRGRAPPPSALRWFYFRCERCGRDSDADGFLLDGDYGDCFPCPDCQAERDVEMPMTFRPATKEEEGRLEKKKYVDDVEGHDPGGQGLGG